MSWSMSKEINLATIVTVLMAALALASWTGTISQRVDGNYERLERIECEQREARNLAVKIARIDERTKAIEQTVGEINRRLEK